MALTGRFIAPAHVCAGGAADVHLPAPIQYYRENARWLERTYGFMERIGVETVRAVVVDDRDGVGERLDAELARSLAAYTDPWLEGREPVTANQFRSVLEPGPS